MSLVEGEKRDVMVKANRGDEDILHADMARLEKERRLLCNVRNNGFPATLHIAGRTQPINGGRGYEAQGD